MDKKAEGNKKKAPARETQKAPEDLYAKRVERAAADRHARKQRPFPACSFEEALDFAKQIFTFGSGQPVRRLLIFDHIGKSSESGPSRQLITNSNKYGLIEGGYQAEFLKLTQKGARAVDDEIPRREQAKARAELAVLDIPVFNQLYEKFCGSKLPPRAALIDAASDFSIPTELGEECVDTFIVNVRFAGLLQTLSGSERLITLDHFLDSLPASGVGNTPRIAHTFEGAGGALITASSAEFEKTCFYITPIGDEGSEQRKHSDLFLGSIVEPAMDQFGLKVIRADAIDKPGTITRQIIDYILRSRLVIADLSFHNPNVFYELAIRHAVKLPIVQIIRLSERVPFDLNQMRTIRIDTSDIYSLVPKIESYRSEIASQTRRVLEDPTSSDNPISTFAPSLTVTIG
jgi:hypothetical protein